MDTSDESDLMKNADLEKKITVVTLVPTFGDGTKLIFRVDKSIFAKCQDEIRFCCAVKGALDFSTPAETKAKMLEYIRNDFNEKVEEVNIFKHGPIHEPETCIILDPNTGEQLMWIKFLYRKITDEDWRLLQESMAGKDSYLINSKRKGQA